MLACHGRVGIDERRIRDDAMHACVVVSCCGRTLLIEAWSCRCCALESRVQRFVCLHAQPLAIFGLGTHRLRLANVILGSCVVTVLEIQLSPFEIHVMPRLRSDGLAEQPHRRRSIAASGRFDCIKILLISIGDLVLRATAAGDQQCRRKN